MARACGLTSQGTVMAAELPFAIGHAAGHMLINGHLNRNAFILTGCRRC
ncbi:DUF1445 domain-containing protein [Mycetohabitans sp. B6]|nr:DUF1445 domain-containing protein [Mycetohabitans sp. B6]